MMRYVNPWIDRFGSIITPLRGRRFKWQGHDLSYCVASYNRSWANERAIEVPIGMLFASCVPSSDLLEVGNVLAHYGLTGHSVVDKYEKHRCATNVDIMDFTPDRRFERILSVSTIEHVGWEETPKDREKAVRAIYRLQGMLTPTGRACITVPLGINRFLDSAIFSGAWRPGNVTFMQRCSWINEWCEVTGEVAEFTAYGVPFPGANCIATICIGSDADCVHLLPAKDAL